MRHIRQRGVLLTGLLMVPIVGLAEGCKRSSATLIERPAIGQQVEQVAPPPQPLPSIRYELSQISSAKSLRHLEAKLGAEGFAAVLKINRLDRRHLPKSGVLILPVMTEPVDLIKLAPFPAELEVARSTPKLILVSRRAQAFAAYDAGKLVRWGPTSTGKKSTPTPAGLYHTNWKKREAISTVDASWRLPWCFNLDNRAGVAFHQFDLPGYPASHGCVRLLEEDARWIYDWADQWVLSKANSSVLAYGTPVVIFGDYKFAAAPPWKQLVVDPKATAVSVAEIEDSLGGYFPAIQQRLRSREVLLASLQSPVESR